MRKRASITWLIGGAVVVLLVLAGVDAIRSGRSETSSPVSLTDILSPAAPTESSTQITTAEASTAETPVTATSTENVPPPQPIHITAQDGTPRHAKYARAALAICASATSELFERANPSLLESAGWTGDAPFSLDDLENIGEWNTVAAEVETQSLRRLEALPAPQAERKWISEFFRAAEKERDLLRKVAGQAAADYPELLRILNRQREDATHSKDEVAARISSRWHLNPKPLQSCPLLLHS